MHSAISTNYREVEDLVEGHVYFVELSALVVWNFPSLSENTTSRARYYNYDSTMHSHSDDHNVCCSFAHEDMTMSLWPAVIGVRLKYRLYTTVK
jgi:hypothetical protein